VLSLRLELAHLLLACDDPVAEVCAHRVSSSYD